MAGLTATGFVAKTRDDLIADLGTSLKAQLGASLNITPASRIGVLVGIMADRLAEAWSTIEAVNASFDPDSATGDALGALAELTGTVRLEATYSTVTLTLSGTAGTVIPVGKVVSVLSAGTRFVTLAAATIGAVGTVQVAARSQDTGPRIAYTGTLSVIETPVAGWSTVTNSLDANPGTNVETDSALRFRRRQEVRAIGTSALDALKGRVAAVLGVTEVGAYENISNYTDANGLPPKSFSLVVRGGATADISQAIIDAKAAGILSYGSTVGTGTTSIGGSYEADFERPVNVPVYLAVSITYDPALYPSNGGALVAQAIVDYGDLYVLGRDAVASALVARAFTVPGVLDAHAFIGTAASPTGTATVVLTAKQLAVFDTSRIVVTSTPGSF